MLYDKLRLNGRLSVQDIALWLTFSEQVLHPLISENATLGNEAPDRKARDLLDARVNVPRKFFSYNQRFVGFFLSFYAVS